jgi:hypothetical protein
MEVRIPPPIIRTGWAKKEGKRVKNLKKRWFVLVGTGVIRYFSDKLAFEPKGEIVITPSTVCFLSQSRPSHLPQRREPASRCSSIPAAASG